ncbi:hypothetical protein D4R49_00805 [bacterium]|nr:MAG: hypothetical protein D4R49_00805 [bacterium]
MNTMNLRNGILTIVSFISTILFPWPFTAFFVLTAAFFEPLVPLAVGLFADALYYTPYSGVWPTATISGLALSVIAGLVRRQLRTGTMR